MVVRVTSKPTANRFGLTSRKFASLRRNVPSRFDEPHSSDLATWLQSAVERSCCKNINSGRAILYYSTTGQCVSRNDSCNNLKCRSEGIRSDLQYPGAWDSGHPIPLSIFHTTVMSCFIVLPRPACVQTGQSWSKFGMPSCFKKLVVSSPDKELASHACLAENDPVIAVKKIPMTVYELYAPQCFYEHHLFLRPALLILMRIISCVVFSTSLIVAASGGVSLPVGIFEGLLSPFGPQVSRLHSRQTLSVPPDCVPNCDAFSTAVGVGTLHQRSYHKLTSTAEPKYIELPHRSMRLHRSEHEYRFQLCRMHCV